MRSRRACPERSRGDPLYLRATGVLARSFYSCCLLETEPLFHPPPSTFSLPRLPCQLNLVRLHNRSNQSRKSLLNLPAPRRDLHLHPNPLAPNQPRLPERLEMLRQSRFGYVLLAHPQEVRASLRTPRPNNVGIDRHPHRIGQRMEDPFHRNVLDRRMKKRPHPPSIRALTLTVQ
jgi:hypothetical protein